MSNGSGNLKMAIIRPIHGKFAGKEINVLFNPAEYSIDKGNTYQSTSLPGLATPITQFVAGNADTLTLELYFDTYSRSSRKTDVSHRGDVREYTRMITDLMEIDGALHAPPICEFIWGPPIGTPKGIQFTGIIEKVIQKYTYFLDDGTPVRATLNVTFKEYKTVQQQLQEINFQSSDKTKRMVFRDGDSLWFLASLEYGDPELWRAIADKNELDNPRIIDTGAELELPPLS